SGAIVNAMQNFFGTDKVSFRAYSERTRTWRTYDRLSYALKEIIDARVYGGIHFRTAAFRVRCSAGRSRTGRARTTSSRPPDALTAGPARRPPSAETAQNHPPNGRQRKKEKRNPKIGRK